jgi:hypothetical protein
MQERTSYSEHQMHRACKKKMCAQLMLLTTTLITKQWINKFCITQVQRKVEYIKTKNDASTHRCQSRETSTNFT